MSSIAGLFMDWPAWTRAPTATIVAQTPIVKKLALRFICSSCNGEMSVGALNIPGVAEYPPARRVSDVQGGQLPAHTTTTDERLERIAPGEARQQAMPLLLLADDSPKL